MYDLDGVRLFCEKYGKKKLVLDTNLFILLLVGNFDEAFIPKFKVTSSFTKNDYELMLTIFRYFDSRIIITPHVLAEVSNLSRLAIHEPQLSYYFKKFIDKLKYCQEEHITLERLIGLELKVISRFGFPDMSIIEVAKKVDAVILTNEIDMCEYSNSCSIPNINFSNIKANRLLKI